MKKRVLAMLLSVVMLVGMLPITASAATTTVSYISYSVSNSGVLTKSDGSCTTYTPVSSSIKNWGTSGQTKWYVVENTTTISDRITVNGTVNLILKDGCTLTAQQGIAVTKGNTLNIYAQTNGTGKLVAGVVDTINKETTGIGGESNGTLNCGTVNIYGGNITVQGGAGAPGIGGANGQRRFERGAV